MQDQDQKPDARQAARDARFQTFMQRLIVPDADARAALLQEIATREAAGEDPAVKPNGGGLDWRAWAIGFARREPRLVMLAPFSIACWCWLFWDWSSEAVHAVLKMMGV